MKQLGYKIIIIIFLYNNSKTLQNVTFLYEKLKFFIKYTDIEKVSKN